MRKRICSIMIAVCMVFTTLPATTFAEGGEFPVSESNMEDRDGSLCSHAVHDETCGYIEAVEGADLAQRKGEVPAPVEAPRADETVYNNLGATGNEANITATLSGTTLTVTGTGAMKDWESANDVPWHSAKGTITTVTIGEGITNIGNCAFSGCIALESVNIPASVMEIQYDAFFGCKALENVNFAKDSKLKSIGIGAFQDCEKLASITIPGDVISIGNSAFRGCTSLTSITIPAKVDMIQISAFSGCSALANVTFEGKTAPRLGGTNVFEGTSTELKIYVPEGATGYSGGNWAGLDDKIAIKPVKNTNTNTEYDTLQAAIIAATSGNTLQMQAPIDLGTTGVTINNKDLTLDLNDKEITYSGGGNAIAYYGTGTLTVTDNSVGKGGKIKATAGLGRGINNNDTGAITISGGTVSGRANNGVGNNGAGTITVAGGTVSAVYGSAIGNSPSGKITVTGGNIDRIHNISGTLTNDKNVDIYMATLAESGTDKPVIDGYNLANSELINNNWYVWLPVGEATATYDDKTYTTTVKTDGTAVFAEKTPLTFTDDVAYDIPASTVGTAIANIDVSVAASGGVTPYKFTATGLPVGIAIDSTTGVISGKPTTAGAAGTATITVTDSDSTASTEGITIDYGKISGTPEATPTATFTATGTQNGTLSGVENGMKYSIDKGANWTGIATTTVTILAGVTAANDVQVVKKATDANYTDSAVQTIEVTQAAKPTVDKTDETSAKSDGKITGVSNLMEYKKSTDSTYTSISGDTVAGLAPGTYHVRVKANGTALASADTSTTIAEFVKGTPTKSDLAYSLTSVDFDGTAKPLTVTAAGGKNLGAITVKYGASTVAPTNAGTYAVTVDIAGSAEYNAATLSLGDYVINKIAATAEMNMATGTVKNNGETGATVTLPGKPDGATYGTPVASGTITMTNMSINDSTLTYTAPQSTEGQTGIITIPVTTATNYNNYSITVTITSTAKTPQSISFTDTTVSKTYGDINFTATATQNSGDGAITYASDDTAVATVDANSGEVTIVGQGTATITATAAETDTYAEATATYTLTVSKAPLAITADNKSMTVGGTKPTYTATSTGLVKDETISGVTFTDNATDTNTKGSFSITPAGGTITGGGNGNYTITYVNGTLTINIDVSAIDTALAAADAAKSDVIINEGEPNTVEKGTKFVKAIEMEALASAIQTATAAKLTVTTISESEAAAQALDDAVVTFKAAIKTGTKSSGGGSTGGGGGSTGGGGSSNPNTNVIVTSPSKDKPGDPTQAEIKIDGKVNNKGEATISITDKVITYAFDKALADAKKKGNEANGITVVLRVNTGNKTANSATVNLPKTVQETIISKGILNTIVVVDNPNIKIGMDLKAVKEINKQAKADVSISAMGVDNTKLTGEAQTAIGSRPVFDLAVKYGNGKVVDDFGNSSVAVTIPYTLQDGEKGDNVFAVYVDENGKVEWIEDSQYDANAKALHFTTDHFSTYGVGYKAEAPEVAEVPESPVVEGLVFTDVTGHWAEKAITFVVERGLLSGVSQTTFGPDIAMTRGMFVTVLGRMANADVSEYKASSFADVATDMYYMGYIEWANKNGIAKGSDGNFMPDQPITREQMAVIMQNYANAMGLALPKVHETNMFADNHKISDYAREAVTAMQRAGIISGRDGNVFDPTGTATRAEVSTVLRHYVELVVEIKDNPQAEW